MADNLHWTASGILAPPPNGNVFAAAVANSPSGARNAAKRCGTPT